MRHLKIWFEGFKFMLMIIAIATVFLGPLGYLLTNNYDKIAAIYTTIMFGGLMAYMFGLALDGAE